MWHPRPGPCDWLRCSPYDCRKPVISPGCLHSDHIPCLQLCQMLSWFLECALLLCLACVRAACTCVCTLGTYMALVMGSIVLVRQDSKRCAGEGNASRLSRAALRSVPPCAHFASKCLTERTALSAYLLRVVRVTWKVPCKYAALLVISCCSVCKMAFQPGDSCSGCARELIYFVLARIWIHKHQVFFSLPVKNISCREGPWQVRYAAAGALLTGEADVLYKEHIWNLLHTLNDCGPKCGFPGLCFVVSRPGWPWCSCLTE